MGSDQGDTYYVVCIALGPIDSPTYAIVRQLIHGIDSKSLYPSHGIDYIKIAVFKCGYKNSPFTHPYCMS